MSEGDRLVDLVREGIDCVLRVGDLQDSDMIAPRVTMLTEMTCAAPAYIDRFGMPASVDALDGHRMVGFRSSAMGRCCRSNLFATVSCATSISRRPWRSTERKV
jgi:DNA-binding transcriptional LysR family regulator